MASMKKLLIMPVMMTASSSTITKGFFKSCNDNVDGSRRPLGWTIYSYAIFPAVIIPLILLMVIF